MLMERLAVKIQFTHKKGKG